MFSRTHFSTYLLSSGRYTGCRATLERARARVRAWLESAISLDGWWATGRCAAAAAAGDSNGSMLTLRVEHFWELCVYANTVLLVGTFYTSGLDGWLQVRTDGRTD